jgi:penicillin-binding protein 1C
VDLPVNAPPADPCPWCRTILTNADGTKRVGRLARINLADAGGEKTTARKWFVLPPAQEWYYRRWNLDYKPLPPLEKGAEDNVAAIALFNPEPGAEVYVPLELDGSEGRIVFQAALRGGGSGDSSPGDSSPGDGGPLFWHLDGVYLGETRVFHEMSARPAPGRHTLTLVDSAGDTLQRTFTVLAGK